MAKSHLMANFTNTIQESVAEYKCNTYIMSLLVKEFASTFVQPLCYTSHYAKRKIYLAIHCTKDKDELANVLFIGMPYV